MTIEEKRAAIAAYCDHVRGGICDNETIGECPLWNDPSDGCHRGCSVEEICRHYEILFPESTSAVDHPSHYNREGAMECINEMVLIFGKEAVMHFCLCNAWKYRYRAADKNGLEDLKKSDWYIRMYEKLKDGEVL